MDIADVVQKENRLTPRQIRFLREATGLSQRKFASTAGVAPETVNRWENGTQPMTLCHERFLRLFVSAGSPQWVLVAGSKS